MFMSVPGWAQDRVALLIANQDYRDGVGKLVNPFNDVKIVGEALEKVGFTIVATVKNATRADMYGALDKYIGRLQAAGPDAIGLIYYSGHGIAVRGENYLIPVDIDRPSTTLLRANGVRQDEILAIIRQDAPKVAHYLILDACRNKLQGSRGGKGFAPVSEQQSGVLIAFATAPGSTASDLGDGGGPYARALAREIVKPGIDDLLMFHNVRIAVKAATGGDQVPWTLDGIERPRRFRFAGSSNTPPPTREMAIQAWRDIAGSRQPGVFETYMTRYGQVSDLHRRLAEEKLAMLRNSSGRSPDDGTARGRCGNGKVTLARGGGQAPLCIRAGSGSRFSDCKGCPEMVVVPAGAFNIGSPASERGRNVDESPVRRINIAAVAIGAHEVTIGQWRQCSDAGACRVIFDHTKISTPDHPVGNVNWTDARAYVAWLSHKTGMPYRLPSEAEWEYAARAGSKAPRPWGFDVRVACQHANVGDASYHQAFRANGLSARERQQRLIEIGGKHDCNDGFVHTSPVGTFKPNAFGLHDVIGNVWEWVHDCAFPNYQPLPADGRPYREPGCRVRMARGGSFVSGPSSSRSANRYDGGHNRGVAKVDFGFRVARNLDPQ